MVTRTGRVQAIDDPIVSPLLSEPCVFYAVEVTDVVTQAVVASERQGVRFLVASPDGKRSALAPSAAVVEGFVAFDVRCRVRDTSPRLSAFLAGKGLAGSPDRHLRVVERRIVVGDLVSASGALSTPPHVGIAEPYRSQPHTTDEAFEPSGLVVTDPVARRRIARVRWVTVGAVAALLALVAFHHVRAAGYHGQDDCPPGTTFQEYYHSDPGGEFCGNPKDIRMSQIQRDHGAAAVRGSGSCVGRDMTYWSRSEEPWTLRLTGR